MFRAEPGTVNLLMSGTDSEMAKVKFEIPSEFKRYAGGENCFELSGSSVGEVLDQLLELCPDLRIRVMNDRGELYSYLPLFLNEEKLPDRGYRFRTLSDGDQLEVVAIASGG